MMVRRQDDILISGYAKLPAHITSEEVYHTIVVAAVVDYQIGTIIEAECSVVTNLAKQFVASLMIGYNMSDGPDLLIARFEKGYHGQAKKAIITALKMMFTKYNEVMEAG